MQRHTSIAALLCVLTVLGCGDLRSEYSKMIGKQIDLGGIEVEQDAKLRIVNFLNSEGCTPCRLQPMKWELLIKSLDTLGKIQVILVVESDSAKQNTAKLPIYYDSEKIFFSKNNLPADDRFHCFLLDEDNRIILIGNPVHNKKIKDLYIRTICERLGIGQSKTDTADDPNDRYIGTFSFQKSVNTIFELKNDSDTEMRVDTIYTSCDCTTATIDKTTIEPGTSACVSVSFKTDKPETFTRDIYVKTGEKTHVFTIRGEAL